MGFAINTNIAAMNSYRNLSNTQNDLSQSLERLSSGMRINRAADDAAGLAISEGLRSQIGGLEVAARNAQDGISVIQTAEGALTEVHSILQRMRDLAVQAGNDSNNGDSRDAIEAEATALNDELSRIAQSSNFNGIQLLDGTEGTLKFQVGADGDANSQISVSLTEANVDAIAEELRGGSIEVTGTSFAVSDGTDLAGGLAALGGAASFTSTTADGVATTVTTGTLGGGTGSFTSVETYADALRSDAKFSANFSVSVTEGPNGEGTGIVVRALDGGKVTSGAPGAEATDPAGLVEGASGTALTGGLDFSSAAGAQASISLIDAQIEKVSSARADLGAVQNRFESAINTLNVSKENLSAAESRIRDTDMAAEMMNFTRAQILSQAGTAMLAQANQSNQGVLQLLG